MPNRIIKESICTSGDYASLTLFERDLFIRLIVVADDYGRFDARLPVLKGRCLPFEPIEDRQLSEALEHIAARGMIELYTAEGDAYGLLTGWRRHQQIRAKRARYPAPPLEASSEENEEAQAEPVIVELPTTEGTAYGVTESLADELRRCYPALDMDAQLLQARAWLLTNPRHRKTHTGTARFLNGWLARAQNAATTPPAEPRPPESNPFRTLLASAEQA